MNTKNVLLLVVLLVFVFGCSLLNKFKGAQPTPSPAPSPSVTPNPSPSATGTPKDDAFKDQKDLLAFASGTIFAKKPPEHSEGSSTWGAMGLIDEIPGRGWAMDGGGDAVSTSMVLEMPDRTTLRTLVFDNGKAEDKTSAKNVTVEISDKSATDGFEQVLASMLEDQKDGQTFQLAKPVAGRWVRLSVSGNYGSGEWTEIMEFRGYGDQDASSLPSGTLNGTYKMSSFGPFHIKQDGTTVKGCYEYNDGVFEGGVDGRVINIIWTEGKSDGKHGGPAVMTFSPDGKTITGAWARDDFDSTGFSGEWNGEKISEKVGNCPQTPDLDKENAAKNTIGKDLAESGRAVARGINFSFNSDMIRPESISTLDQIVALLKDNKDWKMTIEGHTDNVGGEAFNKSLSERRAAAVVQYLANAGIEGSRLSSVGLGYSKPVASNDTEFGRAQNRRVELVKN